MVLPQKFQEKRHVWVKVRDCLGSMRPPNHIEKAPLLLLLRKSYKERLLKAAVANQGCMQPFCDTTKKCGHKRAFARRLQLLEPFKPLLAIVFENGLDTYYMNMYKYKYHITNESYQQKYFTLLKTIPFGKLSYQWNDQFISF